MQSSSDLPRWVAPPQISAHPRLRLIRHENRLFSYAELLSHTPFAHTLDNLEVAPATPQDWWDGFVARAPELARAVAAHCQPRDFEILDLYALEPCGSA